MNVNICFVFDIQGAVTASGWPAIKSAEFYTVTGNSRFGRLSHRVATIQSENEMRPCSQREKGAYVAIVELV